MAQNAPTFATPTYLLTWNPKLWDWPEERFEAQLAERRSGRALRDRWSMGSRRSVEPNSRFLLLKQGDAPRGIFASGRILGEVTEAPHWDASRASSGETHFQVEIEIDELVNPWTTELLRLGKLSGQTQDYEIVAPGTDILAPALGGKERRWTGTSFATPFVAAHVARIRGARPDMPIDAVRARLHELARGDRA